MSCGSGKTETWSLVRDSGGASPDAAGKRPSDVCVRALAVPPDLAEGRRTMFLVRATQRAMDARTGMARAVNGVTHPGNRGIVRPKVAVSG